MQVQNEWALYMDSENEFTWINYICTNYSQIVCSTIHDAFV